MIKVAHITTIDLSLRLLLLNQLRSIQAAGYDVVGISRPGQFVGEIEQAGFRHIPVEMTRTFSPWIDLVSLQRLVQIMRLEQFDIVHTHNPKPGLLGQLAARIARVPVVVNTLHGFYFHDGMSPFWRRFYIAMETIAATCSDVILSQNREDIDTAIATGITVPGKLRYLGNGIDITQFDPQGIDAELLDTTREGLGLRPDQHVVGFVGRLVEEKGLLEFLRAAREILDLDPSIRFLVIGPYDDEKSDSLTPAVADKFGIAHACTFTGLRHDMPYLYALMDVFTLPSHREGFPRSPMEASAMGVPCVVTDIRGCRQTVDHGSNGWLVSVGDAHQLAVAITTLLHNPTMAAYMGSQGRRKAQDEFDERLVFDRVLDEYARLVHEKLGTTACPSSPAIRSRTPKATWPPI